MPSRRRSSAAKRLGDRQPRIIRNEMLKRVRTWLRPKREPTPEDVAAQEYADRQREWKRTQKALEGSPPGFGSDPFGSGPDKSDKHR